MKTIIKYILGVFLVLLLTLSSCTQESYSLGDLAAPTNIVITADIIGKDATHPNGDGSGNVKFSITGDNVLGLKIDYDANDAVTFVFLPNGSVTKKYTTLGVNTYRVTVVAAGKGGSSSTVTKDVTVKSDFTVAPAIVTALTNDSSKTWIVDKSVAGHLGVGPWNSSSVTPEWWAASPNEKVASANCFYTAAFTFTKVVATNSYSLAVATPDGAFTKTGSLTTLPGIPASGDEGCYPYGGGVSTFAFIPSSTGIAASTPSTQTSILLSGVNTFIGYGALQKEYEILVSTSTYLYLRVQGTETGNAWYLKLIPKP